MQMEELTAFALRRELRECVTGNGLKGTVTFSRQGIALFCCSLYGMVDHPAVRALADSFARMGYTTKVSGNRIELWPDDEYITRLAERIEMTDTGDEKARLSTRFCLHPAQTLTESGRQLIMETLRLAMVIPAGVMNVNQASSVHAELDNRIRMIRRSAAMAMRQGDCSGQAESGRFLYELEQHCIADKCRGNNAYPNSVKR